MRSNDSTAMGVCSGLFLWFVLIPGLLVIAKFALIAVLLILDALFKH